MKTIIHNDRRTVTIAADGPFTMIGEKINPTGRKKMAEALQVGDFDYIRKLAIKQVEAGADILDINVGVPGLDESVLMPQVIQVVSECVEVPLCLDSSNPQALEAGLTAATGKPLVNSVTGEENSLAAILPVVQGRGAAVIGLTMDENGIPGDAEGRVAIAEKILEAAARIGIPAEDVVIDPLVMTVGADSRAGAVTLQTIELLRREFGVNINLGASNISFGLPDRHTINQAFLALAIGAGATCAITDPLKMSGIIRASDLVVGRDDYAMRYIKAYRKSLAFQSKEA